MNTAIVTGAAGSLGSELSLELVRRGWNVVMLDSDRKGLDKAYDRIESGGPGEAALHPIDLAGSTPDSVTELLDAVNSEFGGLSALVHCAARFESLAPLEHIPPQEWLLQIQVNLNAPWLLSSMALPSLRATPGGKLVFLLDDLPRVGGALWGAYGVSKHALRTLVTQFDEECRSSGIEVKGVNPGPMRSGIRTRVYHSENPAEMRSPAPAAKRIAAYLAGEETWAERFVDLSPIGD